MLDLEAASCAAEVTEDPDLQGKEDITAQFHRIDASKNGLSNQLSACKFGLSQFSAAETSYQRKSFVQ